MQYRRILVGSDLSENAALAARVGARLLAPDGEMRIVRTIEIPQRNPFMSPALLRQLDNLAHDLQTRGGDELAEWAGKLGLPPHERELRQGSARRQLPRAARDWGADLLVVGHHGRGAVAEKLMGSTAKAVVRHAPCDALVVPDRDPIEPEIDHIVLATDFYGPSEAAGQRARELAEAFGARLSALHVIDNDLWTAVGYEEPVMVDGRVDRAWLEKTVGEMLHEFNVTKLDGRAEEVLRHGDPVQESAEFVAKSGADFLVVGTHGAGALERMLLGSVAETMVERARCPVLIVRGPDDD